MKKLYRKNMLEFNQMKISQSKFGRYFCNRFFILAAKQVLQILQVTHLYLFLMNTITHHSSSHPAGVRGGFPCI